MSSRKKIVWIDDYPSRAATAEELGAKFVDVKGKDVGPVVKQLLNGPAPRLAIIDHVLDKVADTTNPVFAKGSTIAEAIKEKWPSCPVVGITAADINAIDWRTKRVYDALFSSHHFSKYFDRILGIADGFGIIARKQRSSLAKLIELLKPPVDEQKRLLAALTDDLKFPDQDASMPSRMYRWVERLMDRPGFLFNELWSATFLGLNQTGFEKVAPILEDAKYAGVFARPDEPRWWSSRLSDLLHKRVEPRLGELSWHAGRRLPGLRPEHFSACHCCNKELPPETVAYLDETCKDERAMHLEHTELHPRYERQLYFEDRRMMRGD